MADDSVDNGGQSVRDRLAVQRTILANERTILAYARTAIMLVASGATLLKLYGHETFSVIFGCTLILAGIGVAALGTTRFRKLARSLR